MSPAPQRALGGKAQYSLSAQRTPAKPPHILPAEAGESGVDAGGDATGGVPEGSRGAELATAFGSGLELTMGGTLALGAGTLAVTTGALVAGAGGLCEAQPLSATDDKRATLTKSSNRWCMAHALATHGVWVESLLACWSGKTWL